MKGTRKEAYIAAAILLLLLAAFRIPQADAAAEGGTEFYRIRVANSAGGAVEVSSDRGGRWVTAGKVIHPALAVNTRSYSAVRWAGTGRVGGVATHSIHLKTAHLPADGKGPDRAALLSLVPSEYADISSSTMIRNAPASCIVTDIPAGTSIFRTFAPFVGSSIFLERASGLEALPDGYLPRQGDRLVIISEVPPLYPREIIFENHAGGLVTAVYEDGRTADLARVMAPVGGVGRFEGTAWAGPGRITSNHPGVITVSTAPFSSQVDMADELGECAVESRGGFQIVPWKHARDSGLKGRQWMTIAPLEAGGPPVEGSSPLFSGYISLAYEPGHPQFSSEVQVRLDGGPWETLPRIVGRVDNAFAPSRLNAYYASRGIPRRLTSGITHIRILMPLFSEPIPLEKLQSLLEMKAPFYVRMQGDAAVKG